MRSVLPGLLGPALLGTIAVLSSPAAGQAPAEPAGGTAHGTHADSLDRAVADFVRRATDATRPFRSRTEAIRAGYRRLGPDFPGMGEHWIHPVLVVRGALEAEAPPVLSYVDVDGEPVLVGLAYTLPLAPDDEPPAEPFGRDAWHDHSGAVDEETLLLNHPASTHGGGGGHRLSMVHVWTYAENPAGVLAQNNWRLPFLRVGLAPPERPAMNDARGVSLAYGGRDFYRRLIRRAANLSPEEERHMGDRLGESAGRSEAEIAAALERGGRVDDPAVFGRIWSEFWVAVREGVRGETWRSLEGLAGAETPGSTTEATSGRPAGDGDPSFRTATSYRRPPRAGVSSNHRFPGDTMRRAPLDLDADESLRSVSREIEGENRAFDQTGPGDLRILCQYGYSGVHQGDLEERRWVTPGCVPRSCSFGLTVAGFNYESQPGDRIDYMADASRQDGIITVQLTSAATGDDVLFAVGGAPTVPGTYDVDNVGGGLAYAGERGYARFSGDTVTFELLDYTPHTLLRGGVRGTVRDALEGSGGAPLELSAIFDLVPDGSTFLGYYCEVK